MTNSGDTPSTITEAASWHGRHFNVTWFPAPFVPPLDLVTNVRGLCFTEQGHIVLAAVADREWTLPGGHREPGESMEATLVREIREEICASVSNAVYLGVQRVIDEHHTSVIHYHARYWARVRMEEFVPSHEVHYLAFVQPPMLLTTLNWQTKRILEATLQDALLAEAKTKAAR